ncbi:MAG TPA: Sec-independent protein translocase protein TatB [Allosphingosinicella sp.]|nr:Sec-independent protein translocase protein TatB [Allosphingosinicella sp.]
MFGIDSGELLVIAVVALVVIGPKDLPRVMRVVGQFVGRARGMAKQFRSGFDVMIRESELEDMEKQWKADNERIMRDHPAQIGEADWPEPVELPPPPAPRPRVSKGPKAPPARGRVSPRAAAPPAAAPKSEPPAGETP